MKLLLDNGLPRSALGELQKLTLDSIHVGEIGLASASDDTILQRAIDNDLLIVTLDAEFSHLAGTA